MAYDPKDPADKKIVDGLIAEALEKQADDHETEIAGLKTKNTELLGKLKKAREGQSDPEAVLRLETELEKAQGDLKAAQKALAKTEKERDTFKATADSESAASRKLLVDGGLTEALVANNVKKEFLPAVKKLLEGQVEIKVDGETRAATISGKPLGEFVKSWSQSDEGKHYVVAPANGGGSANGGQANGSGGKTMNRSQFDGLSQMERASFAKSGGQVVDG